MTMAETVAGQENFTYIPLSSFIILLVILLTCASRRKKIDAFSAAEQSLENDIKREYVIMCFPCLKRKPELKNFEPTADLSDQFEYIVEKYTIRKVPLLLANTAEDIIERQEELELAKTPQSQTQLIKDEFINFRVSQEVYNVQKVPPCITVAANTTCPGRKTLKDRPKPADILESMSPVTRPTLKQHNYVVIPTKASLRSKDIMMTKREITNQYLNNFSSVFVDNLKDQVPKDPERLPSISRPYTSALRNYTIPDSVMPLSSMRRSKKGKTHKVAYAFPIEEPSLKEEEASINYDSDSGQDQTTDVPESEFQEENENDTADLSDKSKSLVNLNDSDSTKDPLDCVPNPFKTTIKSSTSEIEHPRNPISVPEPEYHSQSLFFNKDECISSKNVTYEDIQALDVGYEFTSCEKLGVKPKMTRIHYPHETDRLKESLKQLSLGDSKHSNKKCFSSQDQVLGGSTTKTVRGTLKTKVFEQPDLDFCHFANSFVPVSRKGSSKSVLAETSFLPLKRSSTSDTLQLEPDKSGCQDQLSTTTYTSKTDAELDKNVSGQLKGSVAEISKLYDLSVPVTPMMVGHNHETREKETEERLRFPVPCKSRSFHEIGLRKDHALEGKGKNYLPFQKPNKKDFSRLDEIETETSCSRESKTSTVVTSPRSSEPDEGRRATLKWKIVIKHHREDDSSKRSVNFNIKH